MVRLKPDATSGVGNASRVAFLFGAAILFLVEGAPVPEDAAGYERLMLLFDGNDEDALAAARAQWKSAKASGFDATYWQQDPRGRWEKKA